MRQSQLFTKTRREAPSDEVSTNAKLLIRAGFIHKEMAGVYSLLPLGLRVVRNLERIIREEMQVLGAQELQMTALQNPEPWKETDRWEQDVWFKTSLAAGGEVGLGWTQEEAITRIAAHYVASYKDLPFSAYQIQTKFRNEERAKSGILRGREFLMKDLYSFHASEGDLDEFYERAKEAYRRVYERAGVGKETYLTAASGGAFSKYSHEFQTLCDAGEDIIYIDESKGIAVNEEVKTPEVLADLGLDEASLRAAKAVEVGNIFKLGTRFSQALGLSYKDEAGKDVAVVMGCYGLGPTRLLGTIAEVLADERGLAWPKEVAPFSVHLIDLSSGDERVRAEADALYQELLARGVEVLCDDRDARAGEKFADADLIGIPQRIVVSARSLEEGGVEVGERDGVAKVVSKEEALTMCS